MRECARVLEGGRFAEAPLRQIPEPDCTKQGSADDSCAATSGRAVLGAVTASQARERLLDCIRRAIEALELQFRLANLIHAAICSDFCEAISALVVDLLGKSNG